MEGNSYEAHCALCENLETPNIGHQGIESHRKSEKHKAVTECQQQTLSISHYCSTSGALAPRSSVTQLTATPGDLRTAFGSTYTDTKSGGAVDLSHRHILVMRTVMSSSRLCSWIQREQKKKCWCGKDKTAYLMCF